MSDGQKLPDRVAAFTASDDMPKPVRVYRPDGSYSVYTGHPSPMRQIAGQIRTSSGFTVATRGTVPTLPSPVIAELEEIAAKPANKSKAAKPRQPAHAEFAAAPRAQTVGASCD